MLPPPLLPSPNSRRAPPLCCKSETPASSCCFVLGSISWVNQGQHLLLLIKPVHAIIFTASSLRATAPAACTLCCRSLSHPPSLLLSFLSLSPLELGLGGERAAAALDDRRRGVVAGAHRLVEGLAGDDLLRVESVDCRVGCCGGMCV